MENIYEDIEMIMGDLEFAESVIETILLINKKCFSGEA